MENTQSYSAGDTALSIIAAILTIGELFYRGVLLIGKATLSLFFYFFYILLMVVALFLTYLPATTISNAGPWFSSNIH